MKKYIPVLTLVLMCVTALMSTFSYSHAYITQSRAKLCQERQNINCGPVIYEPQSVEGADGFPTTGPADGTIASAGRGGQWSLLNEQTPTRWKKVALTSGSNTFNWHFTAVHRTKDFKYYITKQDWDSSQPLSRASFDLTPFCQIQGNNALPNADEAHTCTVPARTGYQIILGVWDVSDTGASFYHVIDADFSGAAPNPDPTPTPTPSDYKDIGDIIPTSSLKVGAMVKLRLFTAQGELANQAINMTIANAEHGSENVWPKRFADIINAQGQLKAGIKGVDGKIVASFGRNDVFVRNDSEVIRTEVFIDNSNVQAPEANMNVSINKTQFIADENITLAANVVVNEKTDIETQLFFNNISIGYQKQEGVTHQATFNFSVENAKAGDYRLITTGKVIASSKLLQKTIAIKVSSPTNSGDLVEYPVNKGAYLIGTNVKGEDGGTYTCKIAQWCNGSGDYYAPGYGLSWNSAWDKTQEGAPSKNVNVDFIYPNGKGTYANGNVVQGADGNRYRCNITNWCNGSESYYAPGVGLAWGMAWSAL